MAKDRFNSRLNGVLQHCLNVVSQAPNMGSFREYVKNKLATAEV